MSGHADNWRRQTRIPYLAENRTDQSIIDLAG